MDKVITEQEVPLKSKKFKDGNTGKILATANIANLETMLLDSKIPKYSVINGLVNMHIHFNIFEGTPTKFFTPVGDNPSSLIVVYPVCETPNQSEQPQMVAINWDVENANDTDIQEYLSSLPDINWNNPVSISGTSTIVLERIKPLLQSPGLCGMRHEMKIVFDGDIYSNEVECMKMSIPDGYRLGPLKPEHAAYVNKMFGNPHLESDEFVSKQFTKFPGVALYRISEDDGEEQLPLSWSAVRSNGLIGRTFTIPELRRRGFTTAVTLELIRNVLKAGLLPKVGISRTNLVSIRVYEKLGFVRRERAIRAIFSTPLED